MKKYFLIIVLSISSLSFYAQSRSNVPKISWNAYTQVRLSSNFDNETSFMLRRLKFWLKSTPAFSKQWSYKIQALFTSWKQERFFLQDAKISYKTGRFSFDMGQFVPNYSLQWTQPDYLIPSIERAKVVNTLHPDGTLGVRDLGIQVNYLSANKFIESHLGVFNGYGIKEYRFDNQGFLLSHKTAFNLPAGKNKWQIGYSVMFRQAQNLKIKQVFPDTVPYTGNDFRYNVFALFQSKFAWLQAEYHQAYFDEGKTAKGYYVLSAFNFDKSQVVLSVEDYQSTVSHMGHPSFRIGYNYLFKHHKIKLMFDNYFQLIDQKPAHYLASLQLQIFLK